MSIVFVVSANDLYSGAILMRERSAASQKSGEKFDLPIETLREIGKRFAALRKAKGERQRHVAEATKFARSTIAGVEKPTKASGLQVMIAMVDHFKVPFDYVLGRIVPPGGPLVGKFVESDEILKWISIYEQISDAERRALLVLINNLLHQPDILGLVSFWNSLDDAQRSAMIARLNVRGRDGSEESA